MTDQMSAMDAVMAIHSTGPWVAKEFEFQAVAIALYSLNTEDILSLDDILA